MKNPTCELWDRENDELFRILCHTCKNVAHGLRQQLRPVDGSGTRDNGQEAFNFLHNRYEGRSEARVRSLLAEMQRYQRNVVASSLRPHHRSKC